MQTNYVVTRVRATKIKGMEFDLVFGAEPQRGGLQMRDAVFPYFAGHSLGRASFHQERCQFFAQRFVRLRAHGNGAQRVIGLCKRALRCKEKTAKQ